MTRLTKAQQRKIVRKVKAMYDEHDHAEGSLVMATRRQAEGTVLGALWAYHDDLEREIVWWESQLPQSLVERLKRGEL